MDSSINSNPFPGGTGEHVGWACVSAQFCTYPVVGYLGFADKRTLAYPHNNQEAAAIQEYLVSSRPRYQQFIRQKSRFPSYDIYACFQPFNECFKALFPFVDYIRDRLRPGDTILNLWDRSGWTASMLSGWFPGHEVITVWEGDKDILGYRGFDYWMSRERRVGHRVVFTDFYRTLPFEDHSMGLIVGVDVLHRFHQPEFLKEVLRVATPSAPIIFPHVHLTNSMPEPFFERGCEQLHGSDYQHFFDQVAATSGRQGYVVSEPSSFMWNEQTGDACTALISQPDNSDYNACIAWLPRADDPMMLKPWRGYQQPGRENMRLLENPLLQIDPLYKRIAFRDGVWGFAIEDFIGRHPIYRQRVANGLGHAITADMECVLYWARQGLTIREISTKMELTEEALESILAFFHDTDLAQVVPVDAVGFRLQALLGRQEYLPHESEMNLATFWQQRVAWHADDVWCKTPDGEAFTYAQGGELVELVQKAMIAEGIGKGDSVLLCGDLHPELLLCFWAAVGIGAIVVPLSPALGRARIHACIQLVKPALAFIEPWLAPMISHEDQMRFVMLDMPDDPCYQETFSFEHWLAGAVDAAVLKAEAPAKDDTAVLLWTTGTTGNPKGIPITHEQLIRSARNMTETYHWKRGDSYYALGGLESMSGLRHATTAIAEVGACCILPGKARSIFEHYENIIRLAVTILTANPSFFKQLALVMKSQVAAVPSQLRLSLCTGNTLTAATREQWQHASGLRLYNYYGLTETSGICIAERLDSNTSHEQYIGQPVDCLVKVIDENGNLLPPGVPGELCIYGAGIFSGYYQNAQATANVLKRGWFYTGDLVILTVDGGLQLTGRIQDIVKLPTGQRVEVQAIEEVLEEIDALKDWAVCPLQQQEKESVAVFFVPETVAETHDVQVRIRMSIQELIGPYAVPSIIEPVGFIPRGNHQKVLRKELLDLYKQLLENR